MTGLPTGHEIRRWTRRTSRAHSPAAPSEMLGDLYTVVIAVLMSAATVFSVSASLAPAEGTQAPAPSAGPWLDAGWLSALAVVAVVAAVVGLATRLGPLALSAAEATWWLPLAVERRTLLRPAAVRWPTVGAAIGGLAGGAAAMAAGTGSVALAAAAIAGGAVTACLIVIAGLAQSAPALHSAIRRGADGLLTAVPAAGIALALVARPAPAPGGAPMAPAIASAGMAAVLLLVWDSRIDRIPGASLRTLGASADEALVAVLSLDPRGLGRALAARSAPAQRRSARLRRLLRLPQSVRPAAVVVVADVLLFLRVRRYPAQVVVAACLPAMALLVAEPSRATVLASTMIGAYAAALATVDGNRRAQVVPALDTLVPIGETGLRLARLVVPVAVMSLWGLVVMVLVSWRFGEVGAHLGLGLLAAPMWAAAATRAARRPLPDFSAPLIVTPMGAIPPGLSAVIGQGPDLAVIGGIPVILALLGGTVPAPLLILQAACTAAAVPVVVLGRRTTTS